MYSARNHLVKELIETLWNVNQFASTNFCAIIGELIETLWNVNKDGCEYVAVDFTELIETLWNVNEQGWLRLCPARLIELIETLWNVNCIDTKFLDRVRAN